MDLRIDPQRYLATLLVSLGVAPLGGCDRSVEQETRATEDEEPAGSSRARRSKPRPKPTASTSQRSGGKFACTQSFPVKLKGKATGVELCAAGYHHRVAAQQCVSELPRQRACAATSGRYCDQDSECTDKPHGFCRDASMHGWSMRAATTGPPYLCGCEYGCLRDADCSAGMICICDTPVGRCVQSTCKSDADCDADMLCAEVANAQGVVTFACQKADDECMKAADCKPRERCLLVGASRRCRPPEPRVIKGRPFLVHGVARTAQPSTRDAWAAPMPRVRGLAPRVRHRLAEHWTEAGLMEHASVAAFARFSLQLLAQAAPPDLVAGSQSAAADEIRHARICFGLASAYAGRPIGPGPLDTADALTESDPRAVLSMVVREGCIGETVAALEAAEAARWAECATVAGTLAQIAADELRHAELAWRYVRWAVGQDDALHAVLLDEVHTARRACGGAPKQRGRFDESLRQHGILEPTRERELYRRAIEEVVVPLSLRASLWPREDDEARVSRRVIACRGDGEQAAWG